MDLPDLVSIVVIEIYESFCSWLNNPQRFRYHSMRVEVGDHALVVREIGDLVAIKFGNDACC